MRGRLDQRRGHGGVRRAESVAAAIAAVDRIVLTACGTSWHAALVGEYLIEELARIPVEVEYASELRYRNPPLDAADAAVRHHAERRNARHAGRAARDEAQGPSDAGDLQRRRQHDRPRGRRRHLSARRTGDRRRLHQGVHLAMRGDGAAGAVLRPAAATSASKRACGSSTTWSKLPEQVRTGFGVERPVPAASRPSTPTATIFCTSAGSTISRPRWKGPSSSRKSATSTPKVIRPPR